MDNFNLFIRDYDEEDYFLVHDIEEALEELNHSFLFHKISVESGYYYGIQFYVEENYDLDELDNDDCRYYFDMYWITMIAGTTSICSAALQSAVIPVRQTRSIES